MLRQEGRGSMHREVRGHEKQTDRQRWTSCTALSEEPWLFLRGPAVLPSLSRALGEIREAVLHGG